MKTSHRIEEIIEHYLPDIVSGKETIASMLDKYPQYANELRPRLEALLWLTNSRGKLEPRPGFISSSRKYIEHQFESVQPHGFWQRLFKRHTPRRWAFNLAAPIILVILLALILNSLALSAQLSIPGDPLYSTKLVLEHVQLGLTFNQEDKTSLYIQLSRERATEFMELVLEGDYDLLPVAADHMETALIASLHSMNQLPDRGQAAKQPMTAELRDTLSSEIFMLDMLMETSPSSAHPGIELAIQTAQTGLMALR